VLSLIFLALALRGVDGQQVWQALLRANPLLIAVALLTVLMTNISKAIRWKAILSPQTSGVGLGRLFAVVMIGQTMNTFAPLRVGDVARAYMVEGVGVGTVLYTVVVEKALDSVMLLSLLAVVALAVPLPTWLKQSGIVLSLALVALLVLLILAGRGSRYFLAVADWLEGTWPPLRRLAIARRAANAAAVVRSLSQGHLLLTVLAWSLIVWGVGVLTNYVTFVAMGLNVQTPIVAALFLIVVLYLGAVLPSSPGRVGVFHYLAVLSLALFGVDKEPALAYGVVLHLVVYVPISLLGAYYLWRESQVRGTRGRGDAGTG